MSQQLTVHMGVLSRLPQLHDQCIMPPWPSVALMAAVAQALPSSARQATQLSVPFGSEQQLAPLTALTQLRGLRLLWQQPDGDVDVRGQPDAPASELPLFPARRAVLQRLELGVIPELERRLGLLRQGRCSWADIQAALGPATKPTPCVLTLKTLAVVAEWLPQLQHLQAGFHVLSD